MNEVIFIKIGEVMQAAVRATTDGIAHVFVDYMAHVGLIEVHANPSNTVYSGGEVVRLINMKTYLDENLGGTDDEIVESLDEILSAIDGLYLKN